VESLQHRAPRARRRASRPGVAVALSCTLLLVPALLLAHYRAPVAAHVKAGPAPVVAAPASAFSGRSSTTSTSTTAVAVARPVPSTSPPASALALTPAVAVLPTTSTAAPTTWRQAYTTTTAVRRSVVTAPPTTRAPTTTVPPPPPTTRPPANVETGQASWYSAPAGYCAHPTLPFGTVITVTNLANGATATCTVEGRGPFGGGGRIVDLDQTTFAKLAPLSQGVIDVRITW